jgi:hypothetical protein
MADEPRLVGKDGERKTPSEAVATRTDLIAFGEAIGSGIHRLAETTAEAAKAAQEANVKAFGDLRDDLKKGEYNIANFPNTSAFNPEGEKDAPRPKLNGMVLWVGTPVVEHEQTREELELLNQLEPGIYHGGDWKVVDLQPGVKGDRLLRVDFPCNTTDKLMALPTDYWDASAPYIGRDPKRPTRKGRLVTGQEIMLREMVDEAAARRPVVLVTA